MAFVQYYRITKLISLLLLISQALHVAETRPTRGSTTSDLIAGNEFLKLFMERDEFQRSLHSTEYQGHGDGSSSKSLRPDTMEDNFSKPSASDGGNGDEESGIASAKLKTRSNARSLDYKVHSGGNTNRHTISEKENKNDSGNGNGNGNGKQVVKLVTSGSKIVFLEEYDEVDDAIVDAVARDIDLKREKVKKVNHKTGDENRFYQESKSTPNDEFKVIAVSVSSSSKRGTPSRDYHQQATIEMPKQVSKFTIKSSLPNESASGYLAGSTTTKRPFKAATTSTTSLPQTTTTTTATTMSTSVAAANDIEDFINRSHKSEFSIEEAEPLTMPQKQHKMRRAHAVMADGVTADSQNSASTNVQNVLVSPALISSASVRSSSIVPASVNRNSTQSPNPARQARINQSGATYDNNAANTNSDTDSNTDVDVDVDDGGDADGVGDAADLAEEKLLPFQTVIYHDTKEGHGPQSRSISYSSISQNVDDLQMWQHTGILAEAQRNVSESLKPMLRQPSSSKVQSQSQAQPHESEPAKFYSVPSKMYSVPSKFYSEPSKVYSQPAKVYGEQEKFYSEPAKIYGQPSKFYSEPAKVYSQPSKVYGEPAKTYWPQTTSITTTTTSTSTTTSTITPASQSIITTFSPFASPFNLTARRPPAIVSRIAFGEAQSSTPPPPPLSPSAALSAGIPINLGQRPTARPSNAYHHENYHQQHAHQNHYQQFGHGQNTQSRRVLFNLDKLPYDLLNAPEQHLLEPDSSKSQPNPCADPSTLATLSNAQQQQQQQHLRQHSSFSDQHSNQNAKGLPNRDLVKCVSKFSAHHSGATAESAARRPPSSSSLPHRHFTTERSHIDELYRPTPEQNYEIEESVSVMTNGRAHGVQGGLGRGIGSGTMTTTSTTSKPPKIQAIRNRLRPGAASGLRTLGNANSDGDGDGDGDGEEHDIALVHQNNNSNNNNNKNKNKNKNSHHHQYLNNNDYNEDNGDDNDNDGDGNNDSDTADGTGNNDDDSKVAYVVEGRNYRKYRVEEKTDDGFIVGEFGVVDHNDGNLRGVRYTADSTINPSLIQKALLTFLKLK